MSRKLATIETVSDVLPIEKANAIEKVRVRDWWCVAKKGEFRLGDACVFFEIDSLLPSSNPAFAFLGERSREYTIQLDDGTTATGYRLRTVKLRGQISQGLALPLSAFTYGSGTISSSIVDVQGADLTEFLGVHLWERPVSKSVKSVMGFARGPFPSFIPKTDEERVQNMRVEIEANAGRQCYVTEKLDGTSLTCYWDDGEFHVCSRNLDLKEGDNLYWEAARPYMELLSGYALQGEVFALQGEVCGEGIQGNPLKLKGRKLYAFSIYNLMDGRYLDFESFQLVCGALGIDTVPILDAIRLPSSVAAVLALADGKSELNSQCDREGIVIRSMDQRNNRLSFKAVSNRYLLKEAA